MMTGALSRVTLLATALATTATAQYSYAGSFVGGGPPGLNVLNNSCSRFRHQSTWKNQTLWVDGGLQVFTNFTNNNVVADQPTGNTTTAQNTYMISVDGSYTWDWQRNVSEAAYQKHNVSTDSGAAPPITMKGALYSGQASDDRIWLFGGTTSWQNMQAPNFTWPTPDQFSLWSFDTAKHTWTPFDVTAAAPTRSYNGIVADVPDLSLGFWINGDVDSGSSTSAQNLGSYHELFQPGMLVFDFSDPDKPKASNVTGPPWGDPRVGGVAQYIAGYGAEGIIVSFGGGSFPAQNATGKDQGDYVSMSDIWVFDVSKRNDPSNGWFVQQASGEAPPSREDSCVVAFASPDNSSHQVYIYGGRQDSAVYDDMYVLNLPSFTWTQIAGGLTPRWGHSCHKVNRGQMMVAGGSGSVTNINQCDPAVRGVDLYNFDNHSWSHVYHPGNAAGAYQVDPKVSKAIGGNSTGYATMMSPQNGWDNDGVAMLFGQKRKTAPRLSGGAIAGIVIGILAFFAIASGLVICLVILPRRRRRLHQATAKSLGDNSSGSEQAHDEVHEMGATQVIEKDGQVIHKKWQDPLHMAPVEVPGDSMPLELDVNRASLPPAAAKTYHFGNKENTEKQ